MNAKKTLSRAFALSCVAVLNCALAALSVGAAEYTLKSSVHNTPFDWRAGSNYEEGTAPSAGDYVKIPKDVNAILSHGDEWWDFVSTLGRIRPTTATSYFTVSIPAGVTNTLACEITNTRENGGASWGRGGLVKVGDGTLLLKLTDYGYFTAITISKGDMVFEWAENSPTKCCLDSLTVESGCVADIASDKVLVVREFYGSGEITSSKKAALQTFSNASITSDFSGKLTGNLRLTSCSVILLRGTESSNTGAVYVLGNANADMNHDSRLGVAKLGMKKEDGSIGVGSEINFGQQNSFPGGLLYLGNGEESNRDFILLSAKPDSFPYIDGGAFGGLNLTGEIEIDEKSSLNNRFGLRGSNVTDCVFATKMTEIDDANGNPVSFHIVKRGSGTWILDPQLSSTWSGAVTVEEGTLKFNTLKEAGEFCALGYATNLFDCYTGVFDESRRVDWAIALGSDNGKEGTMEYTGDKSVLCTTRPIVLKGDGRILQNTETRFAFKGITSDGANPKTLTLDGSGLGENIISGLNDSEGGAISVRKKGSGRWILSANSSIRGDIDVQAGTLCVMAPPSSYEWFRFTDMQVCTNRVGYEPTAPSSTFYMREMAFFDDVGISQSIGLQCVEDWRNVQPGQFAYAKDPVKGSVSNWNKLFDDAGNSYASLDVGTAPNREDESSWFSLVFRMPENSNPVKTFDLEWNTSSAGAGALNHPADFKMEGSVDGLHWVEIFSTNNVVSPGSGKWLYDKNGNPAGTLTAASEDPTKRRHGFSFTPPAFDNDVMDQVGIVSVAAAGTLKSIGGSQTITKFGLDMANGGGTVEGFAFAETGTLYLTGVDTDSGVNQWEKSFNPVNCTGVANLSNWTLLVNGSETSKHSVSVTADGKVRLFGLGLRVIVR